MSHQNIFQTINKKHPSKQVKVFLQLEPFASFKGSLNAYGNYMYFEHMSV
jgi:hypothetical protein